MLYTSLTNKALRLAYAAHQGQMDQSGQPYIFHPYHLAEQMTDEVSTCVALLHDVAEDTAITLEELEQEFPPEVTDALRLLTHQPGTDYFDYVRAIRQNPVAVQVKLADLAHNSDMSRFAGCKGVMEKQLAHWQRKYSRARANLMDWPFCVAMSTPYSCTLCPDSLGMAHMKFLDWLTDDSGTATAFGMKVLCDLGHGFDDRTKEITLLPGQEFSFVHSCTDASGGGCAQTGDSLEVTGCLVPAEQL